MMYIKYKNKHDGNYTIWKMSDSLYEEKHIYSTYNHNKIEQPWQIYYDKDDNWDDLLSEDNAYIIDVLTEDEVFLEMI